ncbi:MAG: haloacid dehalogenase, partial [Fimbriimonadaceae bacterium]|nr:haloacid dehalogenase [Fimbriimonadaceae bacterium]
LLEEGKRRARDLRAEVQDAPGILYAGYIQDAEKELVEAAAVFAVVQNLDVPDRMALGVDLAPYLNGLAEAASECRRTVLDELRKGSLNEAERILSWMEDIYDGLITLDFPDALTNGLRRTCDALRAVLERTRSDLTLTVNQRDLLDELRRR